LDRFHLALDAVKRVPRLAAAAPGFQQFVDAKLALHRRYINENGDDMPDIVNWRWTRRESI